MVMPQRDEFVHLLRGQVVLAHLVLTVLGFEDELAPARRVVHHRHQLHQRVLHQIAGHAENVRVAQLAAQVQAVLGSGQFGVGGYRSVAACAGFNTPGINIDRGTGGGSFGLTERLRA